jgi:benzoyl-CoA reductase subunit C
MKEKTISEQLKDWADSPFPFLRNWKAKTGKQILGYFCTNTPEEMIQAAGCLPVRILGSGENISLASEHLQSYSCSLVQSSLEAGLRGDLDFLEGAVFPHTCDSIQRLSDIWAENLPFPFHWDLVLPVKMHTESARAYLVHELGRFRAALEGFRKTPICDQDLRASFALFNENRSLLRNIAQFRSRNFARISSSQFLAAVKTAAFMPKEDHNSLLREFIIQVGEGEPIPPDRPGLFLSGSVCDHLPVYELLDSSGAYVVGDDLCTGWRYFSTDVSLEGDPIEALAERLVRKVPCPCKYNPNVDRRENFLPRVKESGARGVVFILLKFCDPHAFDYPYLKEGLDRQGVPSLVLEIEPGVFPLRPMETRLKAFVETLEN